jgi:hypothetical protein
VTGCGESIARRTAVRIAAGHCRTGPSAVCAQSVRCARFAGHPERRADRFDFRVISPRRRASPKFIHEDGLLPSNGGATLRLAMLFLGVCRRCIFNDRRQNFLAVIAQFGQLQPGRHQSLAEPANSLRIFSW